MELKDIQIGDILKVRQWDDIVAEYGVDTSGKIIRNIPNGFTDEMKYMCGLPFKVAQVHESGDVISEDRIEKNWCISAQMLEPYAEEEVCEFEIDELENILNIKG